MTRRHHLRPRTAFQWSTSLASCWSQLAWSGTRDRELRHAGICSVRFSACDVAGSNPCADALLSIRQPSEPDITQKRQQKWRRKRWRRSTQS